VGDKTGIADCSARDANGHPAAAPPRSVMNCRRFMSSMGDFRAVSPPTDPCGRFSGTSACHREAG